MDHDTPSEVMTLHTYPPSSEQIGQTLGFNGNTLDSYQSSMGTPLTVIEVQWEHPRFISSSARRFG